jgi:hypothetical protein
MGKGKGNQGRPRKYELGIGGQDLDRLPSEIAPYLGTRSPKKMSSLEKKAETCYSDQIARCYNPSLKAYKYYGGKGVRVCYEAKDFMAWYIHYQNKLNLKQPSVDRVDPNGHYTFSNIQLMEFHENRIKPWAGKMPSNIEAKRKRILIIDKKSQEPLMICKSTVEAQQMSGVFRSAIWKRFNDASCNHGSQSIFDFKMLD